VVGQQAEGLRVLRHWWRTKRPQHWLFPVLPTQFINVCTKSMHGLSIGGRHVSAEVTARTEEEALGIFSSSLAYSIKPPTLTISRPPCASPGTRPCA